MRDYPVVQGIVLVFGMVVVIVSFLSDLASGWLDPRTRLIQENSPLTNLYTVCKN